MEEMGCDVSAEREAKTQEENSKENLK